MSPLIAAASTTTSQIPFWLQILSISAAPIIGFLGVAIGVAVAERNRRAAYLIDEKKKVYLEFMGTLARITTFWSNEFTIVMQNRHAPKEVQGFSKSLIESLQRTFIQIRVLGSQRVVDAAGECFQYTLLASMTGLTMLAVGFDRKEWNNTVVNTGIKVIRILPTPHETIWVYQILRLREVRLWNPPKGIFRNTWKELFKQPRENLT